MSSFLIIPVLDLKHGQVVRARAGDRANYRPIVSPLSRSSGAGDVLRGLRTLAPFRTVYVADLDAISGEGDNRAVLGELATEFPAVQFWLDGGFASPVAARAAATSGLVPVIGTESLGVVDDLIAIRAGLGDAGFVLSLDYRGAEFLGPPEVEERAELWPDRVILMTLDRVGTGGGPDLAALGRLAQQGKGRAVFAAGGLRGEGDIADLAAAGIAGALVATALHDGRLTAAALARLNR
jgi:phosphoribosylformimino-5-aminoimidazole carboxamide ribotide isomerase